VLDTLGPAERLAFVLHDVFGVAFEEIAPIVGRTPTAARQLASRARRRVQAAPVPDADVRRQGAVVEAFFAAARGGDFDALLAVLDPNVVIRTDFGARRGGWQETLGARAVAEQALKYDTRFIEFRRPALVNGAAGVVAIGDGRVYSVMAFTIAGDRIVEIDILADPVRLRQLDLTGLDA
jgi:RNA polymerase sigma-70 factor, ECF subfamily